MTAEFKARQQERADRWSQPMLRGSQLAVELAEEAEADVTALVERLERAERVIEAARRVKAESVALPGLESLEVPAGALVALATYLAAYDASLQEQG